MNSPIYALFDEHFHVDSSSLSTVAFKAIASSIFDRSLRVHSTHSPFLFFSSLKHSSKILGPEMKEIGSSVFLPRLRFSIYLLGLSPSSVGRQRYPILTQTCIRSIPSSWRPLSIFISTTWASKYPMRLATFLSSLNFLLLEITPILIPYLRCVFLISRRTRFWWFI